ncbi:DUF92 domain-containing protein [Aspergillus mulundensis]|uniref:DUF92 domain protein n=1 Tax=Aspergillus mulundensis TaxID=1810919 RepID=A0A3D8RKQ5_9EURO|nr:hypothetical protein DSM5745_07146 [Aspergillus mulundensis]RDW74484.1 hypothetical protein DSM5745_07146 [Aspergillus mulundensis]
MKPYISIPIIVALVHRAYSRKGLTPFGIVVAALTAIAHSLDPWSLPLFLLLIFYLGATKATRVKHDIKEQLTLSATGSAGGEGPRSHIQVLANSIVASVLALAHAWVLRNNKDGAPGCFSSGRHAPDLLVVGIIANYAAVTADTFSSELGILSKSKPRLIISPTLRVVPPGTNGGVTGTGILAGAFGAFTIALTSAILLPFCGSFGSTVKDRLVLIVATTAWGTLGSIVDSVLGGLLQASVVDKRSGKIVEGTNGQKVLIHPSSTKPGSAAETLRPAAGATGAQLRNAETAANTAALKGTRVTGTSAGTEKGEEEQHESRRVESGHDILDNNAVNLLMAVIMSVSAMGVASYAWDLSIWDMFA